jgi:hypothetical protein
MDLRYLEFLLAAYSWAVIVFSAIMVLWLVLNNITRNRGRRHQDQAAYRLPQPRLADCPDVDVLNLYELFSRADSS